MSQILAFVLQFLLLIYLLHTDAVAQNCNPLEEGHTRELTCSVDSSSTLCTSFGPKVIWMIQGTNKTVTTTCSDYDKCKDPLPPTVTVSIKHVAGDVYISTLTVTGDRNSGIVYSAPWMCIPCSGTSVDVCGSSGGGLQIYALPARPSCSYKRIPDKDTFTSLRVICETEKVFPKALCNFYYTHNDGSKVKFPSVKPVLYSHTIISESLDTPEYFSTVCSQEIDVSQLTGGTYSFQARVYPDVTGGDSLAGVVDTNVYGGEITLSPPKLLDPPNVSTKIGALVGENKVVQVDINSYPPPTIITFVDTKGNNLIDNTRFNVNYVPSEDRQLGTLNITINGITEGDFTNYTLAVYNGIGGGESLVYTFSLYNEQLNVTIEVDPQKTFTKGDRATISCATHGRPTSHSLVLTQQRTGTRLATIRPDKTSAKMDHNLTLTCLDTGVYVCRADNGQESVETSKEVFVKCPTQFLNPSDVPTNIMAQIGENKLIAVEIYGYPAPTSISFIDSNSGDDMTLNPRFTVVYVPSMIPIGTINININKVTQSDFRNYIVIVQNGAGKEHKIILSFSLQKVKETEQGRVNESVESDDGDLNVGILIGVAVGVVLAVVAIVVVVIVNRKGCPQGSTNYSHQDLGPRVMELSRNKDTPSRDTESFYQNLSTRKKSVYDDLQEEPTCDDESHYEELPDVLTAQDREQQQYTRDVDNEMYDLDEHGGYVNRGMVL